MDTKISVLKPGLLVALSCVVDGGVNYRRIELEPDHLTADGERVAKWETERTILDPAEFERATLARSAARSAVVSVCCASSFGLLCPSDREGELQAAIAKARAIASDHNNASALTRLSVYALVGRVAATDAEAAQAIGAEVSSLMRQLEAGIKAADPERIRDAANRARQIGGMLSEEAAGKVSDAIAQARKAAREIVKRVEKAGESAGKVVAELAIDKVTAARFAFLDLEAGAVAPVEVAARGLDLPSVDRGDGTADPMIEAADLFSGNAAAGGMSEKAIRAELEVMRLEGGQL